MRAGTLVELELEGQLNIVRHRIVHVVIERVVENGEDTLRRNRVWRIRQHGTQHKSERVDARACLMLAPEVVDSMEPVV